MDEVGIALRLAEQHGPLAVVLLVVLVGVFRLASKMTSGMVAAGAQIAEQLGKVGEAQVRVAAATEVLSARLDKHNELQGEIHDALQEQRVTLQALSYQQAEIRRTLDDIDERLDRDRRET